MPESPHAGGSEIPLRQPQADTGGTTQAGGIDEPLKAFSRRDSEEPWVRQGGSSLADIDREEAELADWAKLNGWLISPAWIEGIRASSVSTARGNEHDVFFPPGVAIRFTNGDKYGLRFRTPSEYLRRWKKFNSLFPEAAVEFFGFFVKPNGNGVIVTSQPFVAGRKGTDAEIAQAFSRLGFKQTGQHSFLHAESGIEIHDAHNDNVLFDKAGNIMPIDVWVNDPRGILG